jgi:hypothetical protein
MRNGDMQDFHSLVCLVHNLHRDLMYHNLRMNPHRDYNRYYKNSRNRSRRT